MFYVGDNHILFSEEPNRRIGSRRSKDENFDYYTGERNK